MLGPIPDIASRLRNVSQIIFNLEEARNMIWNITKPLKILCTIQPKRREKWGTVGMNTSFIKTKIQVYTCSDESCLHRILRKNCRTLEEEFYQRQ
jgi:hypothetical protein